MRMTLAGLLAASALLCTACAPAVGSKEWCDGVQSGTIQVNEQDATAIQGAIQCITSASQEELKKMMGQ